MGCVDCDWNLAWRPTRKAKMMISHTMYSVSSAMALEMKGLGIPSDVLELVDHVLETLAVARDPRERERGPKRQRTDAQAATDTKGRANPRTEPKQGKTKKRRSR